MAVTEKVISYPYEDRLYIDLWWKHLAPKFDISRKQDDLLMYNKFFFKGFMKLRELRIASWNNAWAQDLTEDRLKTLAKMKDWDCFKMIWAESRLHLQSFEKLTEIGYEAIHLPAPPQYICDLSEGMNAYLKTLSHNSRKSFTKRLRKAAVLNPEIVSITDDEAIDEFFTDFFKLHIPYWTEKEGSSYFNDPHERDFIVAWAKALNKTGALVAQRVFLNGEVVNLNLGVIYGQTLYWILTINTGLYHDYGPGIIGLYLCLEDAEKRGIKMFNMGCGDYFYKIQAANKIEKCYTLVVPNPHTMKGNAYKAWLSKRKRETVPEEVHILKSV